jgi:uncharacterized membrane protein
MNTAASTREPDPSLVRITHLTYGLHALGLAIGAFGTATIVGSFLLGWPSIIAVIINYVKRGDARGSWLESHLTWQIRTFWIAMAWGALILMVGAPLALVLIGIPILIVGFFALGVWAIYRIARGWLALQSRHPVP